MAKETEKLNWYYYRYDEGYNNKHICQYMRLDYLIQLLETHNYYVRRRRCFDDPNERIKINKLAFAPMPVGENVISKEMSIDKIIPYSSITECPTACWTTNMDENFFMWKTHATEMGACVRTSVHNVIASLKVDLNKDCKDRVVCGSVDYKKDVIPSAIEDNQLFDKDKAFEDEKEFRFYFYFPSFDDKCKDHILIPVDTQVMIDEVVLSPFICKEAADKLILMLKCAYNINVKQSNIKIKL